MNDKDKARELIEKFDLQPYDGEHVRVCAEITDEQAETVKAHKPAILAEFEAQRLHEEAVHEHERWKIRNGENNIELYWRDGSPLSGWTARGEGAEILKEEGLAHNVGGWGIKVDDEIAENLGEEISYQELRDYTRPAREEAEKERAHEEALRENLRRKAERTGKPQVLDQSVGPCTDPNEECSQDVIQVLIHGDGSITEERSHTW